MPVYFAKILTGSPFRLDRPAIQSDSALQPAHPLRPTAQSATVRNARCARTCAVNFTRYSA